MRGPFREAAPNRQQPPGLQAPWIGDPRINIQDQQGKAKAYQVRQVLLAIDRLEAMRHER